MSNDSRAKWEDVLRAASRLVTPAAWRAGLARLLHEAAAGHHAAVYTCRLDAPNQFDCAAYPLAFNGAHQEVANHFIPRFFQDGGRWRSIASRYGTVFPAIEAFRDLPATQYINDQFLRPAGIHDHIIAMLVTDLGETVGWLLVATLAPNKRVLPEIGAWLERTAQVASSVIDASLALASQCSAVSTDRGQHLPLADLTPREREIARLVAQGLSDLNIAAHLKITEATVGTHLHRIYRKLGVHSRVELTMRLLAPR